MDAQRGDDEALLRVVETTAGPVAGAGDDEAVGGGCLAERLVEGYDGGRRGGVAVQDVILIAVKVGRRCDRQADGVVERGGWGRLA